MVAVDAAGSESNSVRNNAQPNADGYGYKWRYDKGQ